MEIISQNLGVKKLIKNVRANQEPQTEPIQQPQAPAFTANLKGLQQVGKYAVAIAAAGLALTSCEKNTYSETTIWNVTVEKNTEALEELVQELIDQGKVNQANQALIIEGMNTIIALLNAAQDKDAAFQQYVTQMLNEYKALLESINKNTGISADAAQEGLILYNEILNATLANGNLIKEYGNEIITTLKTLKTAIETGNNSIIAAIELMWADMINGNEGIIAAIKELSSITETNNDELIEKLTQIYEDERYMDDQRTAAIIEAIMEVKATVEGVQKLISVLDEDLKGNFAKFLEMYNKNEITSQKMMELIYNGLIESNTLDKLQLEQLHKIYVSLQNGDVTIAEALKEIQALLGEINETLKGISEQLNNTYNAIINLNNDMKNGNKELGDKLDKVIANQEAGLAEFKAVSADQQERIKAMQDKVNEAVDVLYKIYANTGKVTMEDLKAILKENNAAVITTIENALKDLGITIDNSTKDAVSTLIEAMKQYGDVILEGHKKDIDTIINLLSSIDLNTSLSNTQEAEIIKLIKEFKELAANESASQAEIAAKLNEIKALLESIDSTVKAIYDKMSEQAEQFNKFYADYKANTDKLFDELANIKRDVADIKTYGAQANAKLDQAIAIGNDVIKYLEQIEKNQGDQVTVQDLKDVSAENFAKLEAMLGNLGLDAKAYLDLKLGDLIAAVKSSVVDLTTTNNLLQTIIDLVGNIAATMPNNSDLNVTMNELLEAYKSGNADLAAKLEAANTKLQAIYDKIVEMFAEVADLANEVKTFKSLYQTGLQSSMGKLDEIIANLKTGNDKLNALDASATVANRYLQNILTKSEEAVALLEKLGAKESQGLTKAELEDVLADAGVNLQTMLNNLCITINDNTNNAAADIVAAIRNSGIDMTTTNNLLQTIIDSTGALLDSVNSLKNQNITIDTSNVETKLDAAVTAISNGNSNVQSQMDALNNAIQDLIKEVQKLAASQNQGTTTP